MSLRNFIENIRKWDYKKKTSQKRCLFLCKTVLLIYEYIINRIKRDIFWTCVICNLPDYHGALEEWTQ